MSNITLKSSVFNPVSHLVCAFLLMSCASQPRNKWVDPTMRLMVSPDGISADHHAMIQTALMKSGKWVVIDRSQGYMALKKEQERQHRFESDRFENKEKWAHWGKMFGVRGIVVAHADCHRYQGFLLGRWYNSCRQYLAIVDANNGEVLVAVAGENETKDSELFPDWDETVSSLESDFPKSFDYHSSQRLERYRAISAEEAQRQLELKDSKKAE